MRRGIWGSSGLPEYSGGIQSLVLPVNVVAEVVVVAAEPNEVEDGGVAWYGFYGAADEGLKES